MSTLKRIYLAANAVEAHMLKDLLAQEAITAVVRGDDFVPLQGGSLFSMETRPSVGCSTTRRLGRARELAAGSEAAGWPRSDRRLGACRCGETIGRSSASAELRARPVEER